MDIIFYLLIAGFCHSEAINLQNLDKKSLVEILDSEEMRQIFKNDLKDVSDDLQLVKFNVLKDHDHRIRFSFNDKGYDFMLSKNPNILHQDLEDLSPLTNCLYSAKDAMDHSITATISNCEPGGYDGMIFTKNKGVLIFKPIPETLRQKLDIESGHHVIFSYTNNIECIHDDDEMDGSEIGEDIENLTAKRSTRMDPRYMEIAVGLDPFFGGGSKISIEARIQEALIHINGLQSLMSYSNLEPTVNIVVKRMEFTKSYPKSNEVIANLKGYRRRQRFYRGIDAAILLTGRDLYYRGSRTVAGYGYLGGACKSGKRAVIVESENKIVPVLLAHELGHTLGMNHDPSRLCKNCEVGIMNRTLGYIGTPTTWSLKSILSFKRFLRRGSCLSRSVDNFETPLVHFDEECQTLTNNPNSQAFTSSKFIENECYKIYCKTESKDAIALGKIECKSFQPPNVTKLESKEVDVTTTTTTTKKPKRRFSWFNFLLG